MANTELTAEEVEQLQQAMYTALLLPTELAVLAERLSADKSDLNRQQAISAGLLMSGCAQLPAVLLGQFPVLRKIIWDQRHAQRVRNGLMLDMLKSPEHSVLRTARQACASLGSTVPVDALLIDTAQTAMARLKALVQEVPQEVDSEDQHLHIYTDGGCSGNPGPGGIGVVWIQGSSREVDELGEPAGAHVTNSYVELLAVKRALSLLTAEDAQKKITLHTDSQYVYNMLVRKYRAKANQELIDEIFELMEGLDLEILKVPGHEKVWANERADQLATQGVNEARRSSGV